MAGDIVAVFGSSAAAPSDQSYLWAVEVGRLLAEAGFGVINGGYDGLMSAVSQGASQAGGRAIGVTAPPLFPSRTGANPHLTEEIKTASLTERLHVMSEQACGAIALPGSLGTLAELVLFWNDAYLAPARGAQPRPVIALGRQWRQMVGQLENDLQVPSGLVHLVDTPQEAVTSLQALLANTPGER